MLHVFCACWQNVCTWQTHLSCLSAFPWSIMNKISLRALSKIFHTINDLKNDVHKWLTHIHTCMAFIHIYIHKYMRTNTWHTCIHTIHTYIYIYTHIYTYIHTYLKCLAYLTYLTYLTYTHIHTLIHTVYICMHTHIQTHIQTYTYIHIYMTYIYNWQT